MQWTRITHDVNGNPRFVCHFLHFIAPCDAGVSLLNKYPLACKRANKLGGRKFHCRQYGGGIVFQCYNLDDLESSIVELMKGIDPSYQADKEL